MQPYSLSKDQFRGAAYIARFNKRLLQFSFGFWYVLGSQNYWIPTLCHWRTKKISPTSHLQLTLRYVLMWRRLSFLSSKKLWTIPLKMSLTTPYFVSCLAGNNISFKHITKPSRILHHCRKEYIFISTLSDNSQFFINQYTFLSSSHTEIRVDLGSTRITFFFCLWNTFSCQ